MVIPLQAQTGYINALGGLVSLDRQGAETTARFQIGVAKRFDLKKGLFAIGITSGLISRTLNFSQFRFENPNEPLAIGTRESQTSIDFFSRYILPELLRRLPRRICGSCFFAHLDSGSSR